MPDTNAKNTENVNQKDTHRRHSFFGGEINEKTKDLLDFRYNTQEEIDKLNDEMTTTSDLDEIIKQTKNSENNENINNENEENLEQQNENEAESNIEENLESINEPTNNTNNTEDHIEGEIVENPKEKGEEKIDNEEKHENTIQDNEEGSFKGEENESEKDDEGASAKFFDPFELNVEDDEEEGGEEIIDPLGISKNKYNKKTEEKFENNNDNKSEAENKDEDDEIEEIDNEENKTNEINNEESPSGSKEDEEQTIDKEDDEQTIDKEDEEQAINEEDDEQTIDEEDDEQTIDKEDDEQTIDEEDEEQAIDEEDDEQTIDEEDDEQTIDEEDDEQTIDEEDDEQTIDEEDDEQTIDEEDDEQTIDEEDDEDDEREDNNEIVINSSPPINLNQKDRERNSFKKIKKNSATGEIITEEEIQLEQGQDMSDNEDDDEYHSAEEIFEREPEFFADDELSQQFRQLVLNVRGTFKLERKDGEQNPYFKILGGKTEESTLEYLFYLIEEEDEPIDLYIKKVETNLETGEENEHLVQFSYNENKELNIFVDEIILYEKINKFNPDTQEYNDTKATLEKFIFLTEDHYNKLKSELDKQHEERQKKRQLQQIFKGF